MNSIDDLRMLGLFKEELEPVTIIGCGAIGSKLAVELTKIGVPLLILVDPDIVMSHNIANQEYVAKHIGMKKVEALSDVLDQICSVSKEIYPVEYSNEIAPTGIVFLCVDSMETRRDLVTKLFQTSDVHTIIETRMGVDELRVYKIHKENIQKWIERSSYNDENAEVSACGSTLTVGATANICASIACWQYMKMYMGQHAPFEIIMSVENYGLLIS